MNRVDYYQKMGWGSVNPFEIEVTNVPIIRRTLEVDKILESIQARDKLIILTGDAGSGKTSLMLYLCRGETAEIKKVLAEKDDLIYFLMSEKPDDIKKQILPNTRGFLLWKKTGADLSNQEFLEEISRRYKNARLVLFFNEAESLPDESFDLLRNIADLDGTTVVMMGLSKLEKILSESMGRRAREPIHMSPMQEVELREIILQRIRKATGSDDISPFTGDGLKTLIALSDGNPGLMLENINRVLDIAAREGALEIGPRFVVNHLEKPGEKATRDGILTKISDTLPPAQSIDFEKFSPLQQEITKTLMKEPGLACKEIAGKLGKSTNVVSNQLRKLKEAIHEGDKKKLDGGKVKTYYLTSSFRNKIAEK